MNVTATGNTAVAARPAEDRAQASPARSGRNMPATGKPLPEAAAKAAEISNAASIEKAVEQINAYLRDSRPQIEFQVDQPSGRTVMRVMDAAGDVIRQMPSEEVLKIAATLNGGNGFHSISDLA
jgi:flagellar protein FlaG